MFQLKSRVGHPNTACSATRKRSEGGLRVSRARARAADSCGMPGVVKYEGAHAGDVDVSKSLNPQLETHNALAAKTLRVARVFPLRRKTAVEGEGSASGSSPRFDWLAPKDEPGRRLITAATTTGIASMSLTATTMSQSS